jgi:hypothetical protein
MASNFQDWRMNRLEIKRNSFNQAGTMQLYTIGFTNGIKTELTYYSKKKKGL